MQSEKVVDCFEVCKCGMLCVNFYLVAVYHSAVTEFWPFPLEKEKKTRLNT